MRFRDWALAAAFAGSAGLLGGCVATTVVGAAAKVAGTAVGVTAKGVGAAAHGVGAVVGGHGKDDAPER